MRALSIDAKAVANLDRALHEPARLAVIACLSAVKEADFVFLQSQIGMTGGNLSSHIKKLEQAGYITIQKSFQDSRPRTTLALNRSGRTAFADYLKTMRELLEQLDG